MINVEKLFNPKKTIFLGSDEQGKIQARGRYFSELSELEYNSIRACHVAGFKQKNLLELVEIFPNLIEITIEKTSKLYSLEGIDRLISLRKLSIQECQNLTDLSSLKSCFHLSDVRLSQFTNPTTILAFLNPDEVRELAIHGNTIDLDLIREFTKLKYLHLNGYGCEKEILPLLPMVESNFNLEGFPKLKDAGFMMNFDSRIRITWWGPKPISGIPAHLASFDAFK